MFPPSLPPSLPRWPMWRCPSCLSMQWTSLTRCRDTCWTWMTRQALWLPWQRPCWLAVSPRLVLHWQVPRSSEGDCGTAYYLQADLSQHIHINATPQPLPLPDIIYITLCSAPEFTTVSPCGASSERWRLFKWYLCAPKANRARDVSKAVRKKLLMSFFESSWMFFSAMQRPGMFLSLHPLRVPLFFSPLCPNRPSDYKVRGDVFFSPSCWWKAKKK